MTPTYHTESRAIQALVGITITVTGQTFSRLGKKESGVAFLKQTQQKHLHDRKDQFWPSFSERSKRRWLVNDLNISLQNILTWTICTTIQWCISNFLYVSFLPFFSFLFFGGRGEPGGGGSCRGWQTSHGPDTTRTNGVQFSRCVAVLAAGARLFLSCAAGTSVTSPQNRSTFNTVYHCEEV